MISIASFPSIDEWKNPKDFMKGLNNNPKEIRIWKNQIKILVYQYSII